MKDIQVVGKIYETNNYNMFKSAIGNRPVKTKGTYYESLKKSIEEKGQMAPIIVNEKHEVLDGQHRLAALKELGIPVSFIINNNRTSLDIPGLQGVRWKDSMYVNLYALAGGENSASYKYLDALYKEFCPPLSKSSILRLLGNRINANSRITTLRAGKLELEGYEYGMIAICLRELIAQGYADFIRENRRPQNAYWCAAAYCWRHPNVKTDRMIKLMWQNALRIPSTSKMKEYLAVMSSVYNKGLNADKKVYLDKDYEQGLYRNW